jgi:hypothetical protein
LIKELIREKKLKAYLMPFMPVVEDHAKKMMWPVMKRISGTQFSP